MLTSLQLQNSLYRLSGILVYIVILVSLFALSGWVFDLEMFKRPFSTEVAMNPLSAILFIVCGISLLLVKTNKRLYRQAGYILSSLAALVAVVKMIDIHPDLDINIDFLLFSNKLRSDGQGFLTQGMTPATAICFAINGPVLYLLSRKHAAYFITGQVLVGLIGSISWFSLIGYLYHVDIFYRWFTYVPMALHTAIGFLLLVFAYMFLYPGKGLMRLLTGNYGGAITARQLLPTALIVPTLLGFLWVEAYKERLFTVEFGIAILVLSITLIFIAIIWYNARLLVKKEMEKEKAEDVLRYNDALLQNISDAIFSTDMVLTIKTWNRYAEELYGFKEVEVIGKNLSEVLHIEYPIETVESIGPVLRTKGSWKGEVIHYTKDGTRLNVYLSSSLLRNQEGRPTGTVTVARDMTIRKKGEELLMESELRLQTILDTYGGPVYAKDKEGRYFVWNATCVKLSGYSMASALGKKVEELFPAEAARVSKQRDMEVFSSKKAMQFEWEWQGMTENKIYSVILFPMFNSRGEVYGSCGMGLDITTLKEMERNLRGFNAALEQEVAQRTAQLRDLAEHLNTVRETERIEIAREIHDELGQQMTVLKMDVSWLKKKLPDLGAPITEKVDDLIEMTSQCINTIRKIASRLRPVSLDILGLTAAIEWQLKELEKRSNIKTKFVHANVPASLSEKMKTTIFRILQESLTNVARHANADNVIVHLTCENNTIELKVEDNGQGFDMNKTTARTLGILGMNERAAAINGVFKVDSIQGRGTTVTVWAGIQQD